MGYHLLILLVECVYIFILLNDRLILCFHQLLAIKSFIEVGIENRQRLLENMIFYP